MTRPWFSSVRLYGPRFATAVLLSAACSAILVHAQIPGRNVNMVSGITWPDGDPFLQRQNEPSVAASTRNPLHLLAGANDYRTVDLPGLPDGTETGDAWVSFFTSTDGGQRWKSTLIPGYPQDPNPAQPLKVYGAAADPVVRAGTNGLIYYAGLAFNRGASGSSAVFVSRFIDNNNNEHGDPFAPAGIRIVATAPGTPASGNKFLDKPWLAVDIPRGTATCTITTPGPSGRPPIVQRVPAGPVYLVYSSFTGEGSTLKSDIMFSYSTTCGVTWSPPVRLSPNDGSINQGGTIAIEPNTGLVSVAWRRFTRAGSTQTDALMVASSVNFGRLFSAAVSARRLPRLSRIAVLIERILEHRLPRLAVQVEELAEFDQGTSALALSFRTNAYPAMTWDDRGRLYLAWTERGFSTAPLRGSPIDGDAKILMATSLAGLVWTPPIVVSESNAPGHQFMPSLTFAAGKLMLVYYDVREDVSRVYSKFVDDLTAIPSGKRHTIDIRASMGTPGLPPVFASSVRVSDYLIGRRTTPNPDAPKVPCGVDGLLECEQLQFNPPNLPMFRQGTVPFIGDYIDISPAPAFVPAGRGTWAYNTSRTAVPMFHAVWTDNRDVRAPIDGNWTKYAPPVYGTLPDGRSSIFDPSKTVVCDALSSASRNQNIYTARIAGGLLVGSPGNTKPLSTTLQRGFVVFAHNMTTVTKTFRMRIVSQPAGGRASFTQLGPVVSFLDVVTPPRSMASRTVYVTSSDPKAPINVDVTEINSLTDPTSPPGALTGRIMLNADIENPLITADIENADIENHELVTADIENATLNTLITADIENRGLTADIENADIENADIENADIENADIENADIENADIENADIRNGSVTDVTWKMKNTGNTTTAFNVNLFLSQQNIPGVKLQLVLHKTYTTPASVNCDLKQRSYNVLVANIIRPMFLDPASTIPNQNRPDASNGTMWLGPQETGKFTLRIVDTSTDKVSVPDGKGHGGTVLINRALVPGETVTPVVIPQEIGTVAVQGGATKPPVITPDQSTLFFTQQPVDTPLGDPMTVKVQVRDTTGAVLPGVAVHLTLFESAGILTGGDAFTGVDGIAIFNNVRVSPIALGYRLQASVDAPGIAPVLSARFNILGPPTVVTNTNDAGPGSLRQAMLNANSTFGADTILFAIPGTGPHTITLASPLPSIVSPTVIDGTSQPSYDGRPMVVVNAGSTTGRGFELEVPSSVRGLAIVGFDGPGGYGVIVRADADGSTVERNIIGTDRNGTSGLANEFGVYVLYPDNVVIDQNIISGNIHDGVLLVGGVGTTVSNNWIGPTPSGLAALPNAGNGITMYDGVTTATVTNNIISGNGGFGVDLQAICDGSCFSVESGVTIKSNWIGLNAAGDMLGNFTGGIRSRQATGLAIGVPGFGNVISGNGRLSPFQSGPGVTVLGTAEVPLPVIKGNFIGTNPTGTLARPNAYEGIVLYGPAQVGGTAAGEGNLIAGNGAAPGLGTGIAILGGSGGTLVVGNTIGLSSAGAALGNGYSGITVFESSGSTIGGTAAGARNVISGNPYAGIAIYRATLESVLPSNVVVQGNYIGTNAVGAVVAGLGNKQWGISVGGNDITIGGSEAPFGNLIAGNGGESGGGGIDVTEGNRVRMLSNSIHDNVGPGIDLAGDGVTLNDPGDSDSGPNGLQNYPDIDGAAVNTTVGKTYVPLRIRSAPGPYIVQLFTNAACDGTHGEGAVLFFQTLVEGGHASEVFEAPAVPAGTIITATATAPDGSTSEFSNCITVTETSAVYFASTGHFYEYIPILGSTWTGSRSAAAERSLLGRGGHLVTITSAAENLFVAALPGGSFRAWIGLTDEDVEGSYSWVSFEPFGYPNWSSGEPNNGGGGTSEDYIEMFSDGTWNDNQNIDPTPAYRTTGYFVEYELSF